MDPGRHEKPQAFARNFTKKQRRKLYEGFVVIFPTTTTTLVTNPILGNKNNIDSMQNKTKNRRLITIVSVYVNNFRYAVCKLRKEIKIVRFVLSLYHRKAREMRKNSRQFSKENLHHRIYAKLPKGNLMQRKLN